MTERPKTEKNSDIERGNYLAVTLQASDLGETLREAIQSELVVSHQDSKIRLARNLVDPQDAEEAIQDAFIAAFRDISRFDPEKASFSTWLGMIARRRTIDVIRRRERERTIDTSLDIDPETPDPDSDPAEIHEAAERRIELMAAMEGLPEEHREILAFCYWGGLSQSQAAKQIGIPLGTLKSRSHAALESLRNRLELIPDIGLVAVKGQAQ